eukprot:5772799-Amphidinium_carterae.1
MFPDQTFQDLAAFPRIVEAAACESDAQACIGRGEVTVGQGPLEETLDLAHSPLKTAMRLEFRVLDYFGIVNVGT